MAESRPTGAEIRQALGPLEAYDSFHSLLQALCVTRKILSHQALAEALKLDESLVKGWWTGSSRPGKGRTKSRIRRNDEILATFLGVDLDRQVLARWNHLLVEGRRRSPPNNTRADPAALKPYNELEPAADRSTPSIDSTGTVSPDDTPGFVPPFSPADDPAASFSIETGASLSDESAPSQPVIHNAVPDVRTTSGTDSPEHRMPSPYGAEYRVDGTSGKKGSLSRYRLTTAGWSTLAASTAVIIIAGWMASGTLSSEAGRQCDLLSAAPWDPARPSGIKGVSFEDIRPTEAQKACRRARDLARGTPDEARYQFQLGRIHDRMGEYDDAFSDYQISIGLDPRYAAPNFNIGLLHDSGQLSAASRSAQQPFKNPSKAAWRYEQAARLGLPWGRYCYALALLFGHGGRVDKAEAIRQLKLAQDAMRSGDALPVQAEVDGLLEDITASRSTTKHTVCERQNDIEPPVRPLPNDRE